MQLWSCEQLFVPAGFNCCFVQFQGSDRLSQERRLSRLHLHHRQQRRWSDELQRNGRRTATGSNVHDAATWFRKMASCGNRLQQKPIDGLVRVVQRCQVDFPIPAGEEFVIRSKRDDKVFAHKKSSLGCAAVQAGPEIAGSHLIRVPLPEPFVTPACVTKD